MIDVNELRKGTTFTLDGEIYKVLEYQHHKPGRGKAIIRTKIRNLRTGVTTDKNFTSGDRVQDIRIEKVEVQYLYNDGEFYHFMNTETYEQPALPAAILGEAIDYLTENMMLTLAFYEGEPIDITLPTAVDLQVVDAPMAIAGDKATGATKHITLESGLKVSVPLFVNEGDVIRVDTRTGEYVTRV
ncbi:MAG: elongation factor P [Anaerolineae bacterium]|nr:MAG: elongation factor P [Anaerolineae bacterium]